MTTRKKLPIGLILLLCIFLLPISPSTAQTITSQISDNPNFNCYRDAATITTRMQLLAEPASSLSELKTIGTSIGGAPIYALEIGNEDNANKPHFILLAGLHGNDFSQSEVVLQFAETLLEGYDTEADLRWIVDNIELDLILLANPDGRREAEGQAATAFESSDIIFTTNKNNVDLEENFCFQIADASEGCNTFTFEPETQAIIDYLKLKLGDPIPNQSPLDDSHNFFLYFSSHNKETLPLDTLSNLKGRLRIPKFYTPNPPVLTEKGLIQLKELTEMLRIIDSDPKYNIQTFNTEGMPFDNYPVDFTYFTHGIASVELSAPPTYDSRPMECYLFTSEHVENYKKLLMNAAKSAAQPYKIGYGPIVDEITKVETTAAEVKYQAVVFDKNQIPDLPESNPITSIHYYIDQPTGTVTGDLYGWEVIDDNPYTSELNFSIPFDGLTPGEHILTLQACSLDEFDNSLEVCGLPLSVFLNIPNPDDSDPPDPGDGDDPSNPADSKIYLPLIGR